MTAVSIHTAIAVAMRRLRGLSFGAVSICLIIIVYSSATTGVVKPSREAGFDLLFVCRTIVWSQERRRTCTSL